MSETKAAVVVGNGCGQLFAQVAGNGEYVAWNITREDLSRFNLREYDEIEISVVPEDQFCRVVRRLDADSDYWNVKE